MFVRTKYVFFFFLELYIMENGVYSHEKVMEFLYELGVGILRITGARQAGFCRTVGRPACTRISSLCSYFFSSYHCPNKGNYSTKMDSKFRTLLVGFDGLEKGRFLVFCL